MTNLSDADREMAVKILAAWYGNKEREEVVRHMIALTRASQDAAAMSTTARTLVTAEILAAAGLDEERIVEVLATSFEADMFASHELPLEPELHAKYVGSARAVFALIKPTLARLAAESARMRELLNRWCQVIEIYPTELEPQTVNVWRETIAVLGDQP